MNNHCIDCPFKTGNYCDHFRDDSDICKVSEAFWDAFSKALYEEWFGSPVVVSPINYMELCLPEKIPYHTMLTQQRRPLAPDQTVIIKNEEKK